MRQKNRKERQDRKERLELEDRMRDTSNSFTHLINSAMHLITSVSKARAIACSNKVIGKQGAKKRRSRKNQKFK